jgi:Holliday junction resolvasome RuvABC endonuclease subunit
MIISAIDYSLNGPAVCVFDTKKEFNFKSCNFYFLTDTKKYANTFMNNIHGEMFLTYDQDCERYDSISDWVVRVTIGSERIGLEGYAYNATGRVFHIAENTGILKYKLYQLGIPVDIIEPTKVKKLFTTKGNADKELMYKSFVQETGFELQEIITPNKTLLGSPVTDIIDAYAICKALYESLQP